MRSAGNFSPEWGYLAPAPSFMRTARVVMVATAIGATAGAGVVLSLVDHSSTETEKTSLIGAQAIVTAVHAATPSSVPLANATAAIAPVTVPTKAAAPLQTAAPVQTMQPQSPAQALVTPPAAVTPPAIAGSANSVSAPNTVPNVASLSEGTPAGDSTATAPDDTAMAPAAAPPKKPKHQGTGYASNSGKPPGIGTVLRHLFNPPQHTGNSYYPSR